MARIRNIKPEFFISETVSTLPLRARLTWIGLWTHCDNHGRARDNVRLIKGAVWPLDNVSLKEIEEDLETLAAAGRIVRYEVDGKRYLVITNWGEHQYGAFKGEPKHPDPESGFCLNPDGSRQDRDESGRTNRTYPVDNLSNMDQNPAPPAEQEKSSERLEESRRGLEESSGIQVSGVRGQGGGTRETAPPPRCPRHLNNPTTNACRQCGQARAAVEAWARERERALKAATRDCRLCNADGQRWHPAGKRHGTTGPCDHQPPEQRAVG